MFRMAQQKSNRTDALNKIKKLVEKFEFNESDYISTSSIYNETEVRRDFIDPFFEALGWDVSNKKSLPQNIREVIHEANVDVGDENKKPDYAFRVYGIRKYFVEAKKPSVNISSNSKSAFQLRRYGWSAKMPVSVLSNFRNLSIYDCKPIPKEGDNYRIGRIKHYSYNDYITKFDEIYDSLSREAIFSGKFDEIFGKIPTTGIIPVDSFFLTQIEKWREMLANEIFTLNPKITQTELNYVIQTFLNRLIFLRICEDRSLEKYQTLMKINSKSTYKDLLKLFKSADSKYNSGLFNFTKDVLAEKIDLGNKVLLKIICQLYYPQSPYVFSVIESSLLGEIYEMFLIKEIIIEKKKVLIREKPEITHDKGVVTTPKFIIDEIVSKSIQNLIDGKSPKQIESLNFADICCGSGAFLMGMYQHLVDYSITWYVNDGPDKHKKQIYQGPGNSWFLTLEEKRKILLNNIFGVDIDANAVEVTKFSLLIKLLENENTDSLTSLYSQHKLKALPDLDDNIQHGNSLIGNEFYKFKKASELNHTESDSLQIFDWKNKFEQIIAKGGFDAIVGNPPYTRIQIMKQIHPLELEYYQNKKCNYICSKKDNFDKYFIFIERALQLLSKDGILGYITPHKFTKIKSGESLRQIISANSLLKKIIHFGKEQVFEKTTTYTCILFLQHCKNLSCDIELVTDLNSWKLGIRGVVETMKSTEISKDPWVFIIGPLKQIHQKLEKIKTKLDGVADIYVGLQTSLDKVYIIKPDKVIGNKVSFKDTNGKKWVIEKNILKPCIYDLTLHPFLQPPSNSNIIFPYSINSTGSKILSPTEMSKSFPETLKYLQNFKADLMKRHVSPPMGKDWYRFGRSQSLSKFDGREKLIVQVLSLEPRFAYDNQNSMFTGGGNGPYYGVSLKKDASISILYLQAILNSRITNLLVESSSSVFRGGYFSYGKQFIENLPIVIPNLENEKDKKVHDDIINTVKKIHVLASKLDTTTIPATKESIKRQMNALKEELDSTLCVLYNISDEESKYLMTVEMGE